MHGSAASSLARKRVRLDGVSHSYDARVRAIRPDLADVALAELYFAPHYAEPVLRRCVAPSTAVRGSSGPEAGAVTELLHGEAFHMLDARGGWAWGYCGHDHYVGYVPLDALGDPDAATHVATSLAPVFAAADFKSMVQQELPQGSRVSGTIEGDFLATEGGFIHLRHLRAIADVTADWVSVAETYLGTPYVWGGRGGLGIDCSGLVQMALAAGGIAAPRDTDQQVDAVGTDIPEGDALRRGDLVFFPGHVGLMMDGERIIHANSFAMAVTIESLAEVTARFAAEHEQPVTARHRITP